MEVGRRLFSYSDLLHTSKLKDSPNSRQAHLAHAVGTAPWRVTSATNRRGQRRARRRWSSCIYAATWCSLAMAAPARLLPTRVVVVATARVGLAASPSKLSPLRVAAAQSRAARVRPGRVAVPSYVLGVLCRLASPGPTVTPA